MNAECVFGVCFGRFSIKQVLFERRSHKARSCVLLETTVLIYSSARNVCVCVFVCPSEIGSGYFASL